jgi:type I restriction enzyme M protein
MWTGWLVSCRWLRSLLDHNLDISRYVQVGEEAEDLDVAEEVEKLLELRGQRDAAEAKMMGLLKELGYVA